MPARRSIWASRNALELALRLDDADDSVHYVVHEREVAQHVAVVEDLDGVVVQHGVREKRERHVRAVSRAVGRVDLVGLLEGHLLVPAVDGRRRRVYEFRHLCRVTAAFEDVEEALEVGLLMNPAEPVIRIFIGA